MGTPSKPPAQPLTDALLGLALCKPQQSCLLFSSWREPCDFRAIFWGARFVFQPGITDGSCVAAPPPRRLVHPANPCVGRRSWEHPAVPGFSSCISPTCSEQRAPSTARSRRQHTTHPRDELLVLSCSREQAGGGGFDGFGTLLLPTPRQLAAQVAPQSSLRFKQRVKQVLEPVPSVPSPFLLGQKGRAFNWE